jgi:DNA-binding CsgD family transcriptional regulator
MGAGSGLDATAAALHGLLGVLGELCDERPVLVAVDDSHWADEPSLRFLGYLAGRLESLPLAVVLAARPSEPGARTGLVSTLSAHAGARWLRPGALSEEAVGQMARVTLGQEPARAFTRACRTATDGNPFLLTELLGQLARDGVEPVEHNADRVATVTPDAVRRAVILRLARLSPEAVGLAEVTAVLGREATVSRAAQLAQIDEPQAVAAAEALIDADIFARTPSLEFVHPLVLASVREEISPVRQGLLHDRAAALLAQQGAAIDSVAVHYLHTEPRGDPATVARLRAAAESALRRGAPDIAARYLRRALAEPPLDSDRAEVLAELGRAEVRANGPAGFAALEEALGAAADPSVHAVVALEYGRAARMCGDFQRAAAVLGEAIERLGPDDQLADALEGERLSIALADASLLPLCREALPGLLERYQRGGLSEPNLLGVLAISLAASPRTVPLGVEIAQRALSGMNDWGPERVSAILINGVVLVWADRLPEALSAWSRLGDAAEEAGYALTRAVAFTFRSWTGFRSGQLADAEADARLAKRAIEPHGFMPPEIPAFLTEVLIDTGGLDEADQIVVQAEEPPDTWSGDCLLAARARLRLQQRRPADALDDLETLARHAEAQRLRNPGAFDWRSLMALALRDLGRDPGALLAEETELARRAQSARALGIALCRSGLVEGGSSGLTRMEEAVEVLARSAARLEHARALVELGSALRRERQRAQARDRLREGLDLAQRCGATALAERARDELHVAGAKPRRDALRGRDALTAGELRVARLAAGGLSNRQIAQELFLTRRTVETHLTHTYQKLDITSREELPDALAERTA